MCKRACAVPVRREQLGPLQEGQVGVVWLTRCSQCQREQRAPQCPETEGRRSCFLDLWSMARLCSSRHPPAVSLGHPGSQEHSLGSQPFPSCSPIAWKCSLLSFFLQSHSLGIDACVALEPLEVAGSPLMWSAEKSSIQAVAQAEEKFFTLGGFLGCTHGSCFPL